MASKQKTIFYGCIPDCFGYGISALGHTEAQVLAALEKSWDKWIKDTGAEDMGFTEVLDYFGGCVKEVEIGKPYFEGMGE